MKNPIPTIALLATLTLAACGGSDSVSPPQISTPPATTSVLAGGSATLSVQATGANLSYQWQRNGADIAGANSASYTLAITSTADQAANYTVVVSNAGGSVTSSPAVLYVVPADAPARRSLARLALTSNALQEIAAFGPTLFASATGSLYFPPTVCGSGAATGTLDGAAAQPGAGFAAGTHTLQATFADCEWYPQYFVSGGVAATINAAAVPIDATGWTIDAQLTAARTRWLDGGAASYDNQATGAMRLVWSIKPAQGDFVDEINLVTPSAGLVFTNNRLGAQAMSATLRAGTVQLRDRYNRANPDDFSGESEIKFDSLRFEAAGVPYLAQGGVLYTFAADGSLIDVSGELMLTSHGLRVGRIFGANTPQPGLYYEIDGKVTPFPEVADPAAAPRAASAVQRTGASSVVGAAARRR